MFEAKLTEGIIFKKIVESIKDIVTDVNIDVGPTGKSFPAFFDYSFYRNLSISYGQLPCCLSFPQFKC